MMQYTWICIMRSQMSQDVKRQAERVHIIPKAGIRRIVQLEIWSGMASIRRCPETMLTSGSASMTGSPAAAGWGLAAIGSWFKSAPRGGTALTR